MFLCSNKYNENKEIIKSGWNKFRMWSQYGDKHFGICIVFSKNNLNNYLKKICKDVYYKSDFVEYTEYYYKYNKATQIDANKVMQMSPELYSLYHLDNHNKYFFFQKNIDYKDESEYRVIIYDKNNDYIYVSITEFIKGIIIGDRTSMAYKSLIKESCKKLNICCRRLSYDKEQLHLLYL